MLKAALKNFFKKHFYAFKMRDRLSPGLQVAQRMQMLNYQVCQRNGSLPDFNDTGFKVFSQFEEDGKLLYIFSLIGMGSRTFVDLGANDGVNSNCANLVVHFGWRGLFVDGDKRFIEIGKRFYKKTPDAWSYKPHFLASFIKAENVNSIIKPYFSGEIDLLSIDIDGNDYWIWKAIDVIQPRVVIIESQVAFGTTDIAMPYQPDFVADVTSGNLYGASTAAMNRLGKEKGYRLVGTNQYGNNLFFVRNGIAEKELPEKDFESTLKHPWATEKFLDADVLQKLKSN